MWSVVWLVDQLLCGSYRSQSNEKKRESASELESSELEDASSELCPNEWWIHVSLCRIGHLIPNNNLEFFLPRDSPTSIVLELQN